MTFILCSARNILRALSEKRRLRQQARIVEHFAAHHLAKNGVSFDSKIWLGHRAVTPDEVTAAIDLCYQSLQKQARAVQAATSTVQ